MKAEAEAVAISQCKFQAMQAANRKDTERVRVAWMRQANSRCFSHEPVLLQQQLPAGVLHQHQDRC